MKTKILRFLYKNICKQVFFAVDPEKTHDLFIRMGQTLGASRVGHLLIKKLFYYDNFSLSQSICGINFKNPIGLAAGFDKDGLLTNILPEVGFGFEEIGSVTGKPCLGNKKPRLWRLKSSKSLLVNYGLKNDGAEKIARRLKGNVFRFPVGISIAKTNNKENVSEDDGIADYKKALENFVENDVGDYFAINISCPNAFGGEPFTEPKKLDRLLTALNEVGCVKPIFIKMPAEISLEMVDGIIEVAEKHKLAGFICSNLAKSRDNPKIIDKNIPHRGGISGKVVEDLADKQIRYIYKKTSRKFVIIGCGGIFNTNDAYKKILLGASLLQLITGMIFEGPQLVGEINKGLSKLLEKDGYKNISEAVGKCDATWSFSSDSKVFQSKTFGLGAGSRPDFAKSGLRALRRSNP